MARRAAPARARRRGFRPRRRCAAARPTSGAPTFPRAPHRVCPRPGSGRGGVLSRPWAAWHAHPLGPRDAARPPPAHDPAAAPPLPRRPPRPAAGVKMESRLIFESSWRRFEEKHGRVRCGRGRARRDAPAPAQHRGCGSRGRTPMPPRLPTPALLPQPTPHPPTPGVPGSPRAGLAAGRAGRGQGAVGRSLLAWGPSLRGRSARVRAPNSTGAAEASLSHRPRPPSRPQGVNTTHILKTRGLTKSFHVSGLLVRGQWSPGAESDGRDWAARAVACIARAPRSGGARPGPTAAAAQPLPCLPAAPPPRRRPSPNRGASLTPGRWCRTRWCGGGGGGE
jgi:hypothetical protein